MTRRQTQWHLKRAYDQPTDADGVRVLVDRLWPRGLAKAGARIDRHDTDVAPSTQLREWYGHDPARHDEFAQRYRAELDASGAAEALARDLADQPVATLLVASRDVEHSQGPILVERLRGGESVMAF